jgi:hypothetical protein
LAKSKPGLVSNAGLISGEEIDIQPVGGWGDDDLQMDDEDGVGKEDGDILGEEGMSCEFFYVFVKFRLILMYVGYLQEEVGMLTKI